MVVVRPQNNGEKVMKSFWKRVKRWVTDWRIYCKHFKETGTEKHSYKLVTEEEALRCLQDKLLACYGKTGFAKDVPSNLDELVKGKIRQAQKDGVLMPGYSSEWKNRYSEEWYRHRIIITEIVMTAIDIARLCDTIMRGDGPVVEEKPKKPRKKSLPKGKA